MTDKAKQDQPNPNKTDVAKSLRTWMAWCRIRQQEALMGIPVVKTIAAAYRDCECVLGCLMWGKGIDLTGTHDDEYDKQDKPEPDTTIGCHRHERMERDEMRWEADRERASRPFVTVRRS